MTKKSDPTAYLRREARADWRSSVQADRDRGVAYWAKAYMDGTGLFDPWKGVRGISFLPIVEGLPWNPDAPKRIVAYRVMRRVEAEWREATRRGRGAWVRARDEELARAPVPHWDYDGNPPEVARDAWERAQTHLVLDWAAQDREYERTEALAYDRECEAVDMEERETR